MDAFKSDIYKYLGGVCHYLIPLYQRTYTWGREHCVRLWNDIEKLHNEKRIGHFVGSIVRINEASAAGSTRAMIIDGQQRLTTLTLLLIALRDFAKTHQDCGVNPDKIMESHLINKFEQGIDKYKLVLTQSDRAALINKIENAPIPFDLRSRVIDNYLFFARQIEKQDISASDLYDAIGKLQLVDIVLDRQYDNPQAIFESLNSTGMNLSASDLIRNYLLMGLDSVEQTQVYNNIWRPTEVLFDYDYQSQLLDNFFRDYLTMKLGRIPREKEIYKEFRDFHEVSQMPIGGLCQEIYNYAKHYTDMYSVRSNNLELKSLYADMKAIRMEVAYPFLLKVHQDCSDGIISLEDLRTIVGLCVSYVLRRAVCDIPTNSLNKTFATMKNAIRNEDYLNSVKAFFILLDSYKVFPDNKRFLEALLSRDIYNMNKCRYILERLEQWDNKSVVSFENLTIEHIIPAEHGGGALPECWQQMIGAEWMSIWNQYVNTIGNLTMTAYNSEMSDLSFEQKLEMAGGFRESALRLNKYVVSQSVWSEKQVIERAKSLGEIARQVWAYPELSSAELAPYRKSDEESQYSIDNYENINGFNRMLFENLDRRIMNLDTSVRREFKKRYIAYKTDTNFTDIVIQKSRIRIVINMKYSDIIDPQGLCKDVTGLGKWGNGDIELYLDGLDGLDNVMEIIKQSFVLHEND